MRYDIFIKNSILNRELSERYSIIKTKEDVWFHVEDIFYGSPAIKNACKKSIDGMRGRLNKVIEYDGYTIGK
jgi:hypothetical protein